MTSRLTAYRMACKCVRAKSNVVLLDNVLLQLLMLPMYWCGSVHQCCGRAAHLQDQNEQAHKDKPKEPILQLQTQIPTLHTHEKKMYAGISVLFSICVHCYFDNSLHPVAFNLNVIS